MIFCAIYLTQIQFICYDHDVLILYMDSAFQLSLAEFGLTSEEAAVYDALLEVGQSPVSPIAALAKVNRSTCYNILESLVAKKLVSRSRSRSKRAYVVDDPTHLMETLQKEKAVLEKKIQHSRELEKEIRKRFAQKNTKPIIKYVEGIDGLIELYEDSLRCENKKEGIRSYTSIRDLAIELGDYPNQYYTERARRGIPIRGIVPDTEYGKQVKRKSQEFLRTVHLIPKEKFDFSPEIYLYDNKLTIMSSKEKFGFMLESKEIVDALKVAWELAWERAEEYDKKISI